MSKSPKSINIDNFLIIISEKLENFSRINPGCKIMVSVQIHDEDRNGWATMFASERMKLSENLAKLDEVKSELIQNEVCKFSDFLNREMSKL
jgi:hypothetical protein